jgi:general transcription factor 3C polypeptide 3 (transcription factor C subunit 4)
MSVLASYLSAKYSMAFDYIRQILNLYPDKTVLWNMLALIVSKTEDIRHHRYCMRMMSKYPDNQSLIIMNGHNAFVSGNYKFAISKEVCLTFSSLDVNSCFP